MAPPSPAALADSPSTSPKADKHFKDDKDAAGTMESNQDIPARFNSWDSPKANGYKDDAATIAAGEELKQTTISDKNHTTEGDAEMEESDKSSTPELEPAQYKDDTVMRERISTLKKKRGRDVEDEGKDADNVERTGEKTEGLNREKKRPREITGEPAKKGSNSAKDASDDSPTASSGSEAKKSRPSSPKPVFGSNGDNINSSSVQTAPTAFAASGFASLASSTTSPFGTTGASKPSVFGGGAGSGFGGLSGAPPLIPPTTADKPIGFSFGNTGATSGFGSLNPSGSVFGSGMTGGFGGGSGPRLTNFAAPGAPALEATNKPTPVFGAPVSDDGGDGADDGSEKSKKSGDEDDEQGVRAAPEERKKMKKVKIQDGETDEATLMQIHAKLLAFTQATGWRERGKGVIKLNVPKSTVDYDSDGNAVSGSFDISGLDTEEDENAPRQPRLIMRVANTHRVILNANVFKLMKFDDKPVQKGAAIMFTVATEDTEAPTMQMLLRMTENDAKVFHAEIDSVQREL
ncbi:hypothetical protein BJ878DRAFT_483180 [Calycina marina]|uniref:RanBD1 domain-containing protein n=1 Tax=Calycina marina TaxID=1763456 RepID=A0A9P8CDD7_9HELO|nr:hypothetical protein BJ878DRAFT_483180 [Calycina marina]